MKGKSELDNGGGKKAETAGAVSETAKEIIWRTSVSSVHQTPKKYFSTTILCFLYVTLFRSVLILEMY